MEVKAEPAPPHCSRDVKRENSWQKAFPPRVLCRKFLKEEGNSWQVRGEMKRLRKKRNGTTGMLLCTPCQRRAFCPLMERATRIISGTCVSIRFHSIGSEKRLSRCV